MVFLGLLARETLWMILSQAAPSQRFVSLVNNNAANNAGIWADSGHVGKMRDCGAAVKVSLLNVI